jgi:ketosteroid isomerase-like protein
MTTTAERAPVLQRFAQALLSLDEDALAENSTHDLTWTIPGHGLVSGIHLGVPAVIAVATTIRDHGITIEVEQILSGRNGVAAILHERGNRNRGEKPLDVRVALTLLIRDGRVATITGYISDADAYDNYLDQTPLRDETVHSSETSDRDQYRSTAALRTTRCRPRQRVCAPRSCDGRRRSSRNTPVAPVSSR